MSGAVWLVLLILAGVWGWWWITRDRQPTLIQAPPPGCACGRYDHAPIVLTDADGRRHHPNGCGTNP